MKKLLTLFLAVMLLAGTLTIGNRIEADEGYQGINNIRIDENGIMTWDPVPGVTRYMIYCPAGLPDGVGDQVMETRYDIHDLLLYNGFGTGDYSARITAEDDDWNIVAQSDSPAYHFTNNNVCPKPSNVRWDGNTVRWDAVGGSEYHYRVKVYEEGHEDRVDLYQTGDLFLDVSESLEYQDRQYYATVQAGKYEWADSEPVSTDKRAGRFTIRDITLSADGNKADFNGFKDDEGNPPYIYNVYVSSLAVSGSVPVYETPFDLDEVLYQLRAETGTYGISGIAFAEGYVQISKMSNEITYDFVKPEGDYVEVFFMSGMGDMEKNYFVTIAGKSIPAPKDPRPYDGWVFTGWYADPECTIPFDFNTPITSDITVYADYEERTYATSAYAYPAEGGNVSINDGPLGPSAGPVFTTAWTSNTLTAKPNDGYAFVAWHLSAPDGVIVNEDLNYWATVEMKNASYYAEFRKGYRITFTDYSGFDRMDTVYVDAGAAYTVPECTYKEPLGMQFVQWNLADESTGSLLGSYQPGDTITVNGNYVLYPEYAVIPNNVTRLSGRLRFDTSLRVAEELKKALDVDKFQCVVLATGDKFADALGGGSLASSYMGPILLTKESQAANINAFIKENLRDDGIVYVLGGTGAVSEKCLEGLEKFDIRRLSGKSRYDTNLAILNEVFIMDRYPILICSGENFADALAASATGLPMLLVNTKKNVLTDAQKEFLAAHPNNPLYIIGGEGAVSKEIEDQLSAYSTPQRVKGSGRYETSVAIAEKFLPWADRTILAYSHDFPDGLCAGPLASALGASILLTRNGNEAAAQKYCYEHNISSGYVTGGAGRIADDTAKYIFNVTEIR
ncbi:MAG: cell wall-binding repeat-containing protein [Erysipelotrichaceae bacterium]|nr:cell wall-binding repeat-containing protein [Erysipelotrichaceae bacterium]